MVDRLAEAEQCRRHQFATRLHRAAADYLVLRGRGRTIVAGYPWFTDWGRDTFISLRGLCLATGHIEEAGRILTEWSQLVSEGALPNRFPDHGDVPEYNSVDASLWYIVAVHDYLKAIRGLPGIRVLRPTEKRCRSPCIKFCWDMRRERDSGFRLMMTVCCGRARQVCN